VWRWWDYRRLPVRPPNTPPIRATSNCASGHRIARPLRPPKRHNRRQKRRRNGGRPPEGNRRNPRSASRESDVPGDCARTLTDRAPRIPPFDLAVSSSGAHEARFRGHPAKREMGYVRGPPIQRPYRKPSDLDASPFDGTLVPSPSRVPWASG
jgi:hypothetical protein